jgi:glycosyltransferase involved in cell wall biosynthesis
MTTRPVSAWPGAAAGAPAEPRRGLKVALASWAPFVGGAEVAAERLAVGLQEAGHEAIVVLGTRGPVLERMEQAALRCLYSPMYFTDKWHWWRYRLARNALRRLFLVERPDIVHSNDLPTHQIVSDALRGTGIPEVCHHRWIFPGPAIDWLTKFGGRHHLFVSHALMDELCAASPRLRAASRSVVYDGLPLPPEPNDDSRREARDRLRLPADKVIVTIAGQIIERKGVADLLHAWARLDSGVRGRAELLLVGDDIAGQGEYRRAMEALARQLGYPCRFVGFQKDVADWLLASDVAVVPSHAEPLGNATLEAMSYALPVLGCRVGGIPEMVVHEGTGLLVPPRSPDDLAAALTRLIADTALRSRLGQQGRERCREVFSLTTHVRAALREYGRVLPTGRPACVG